MAAMKTLEIRIRAIDRSATLRRLKRITFLINLSRPDGGYALGVYDAWVGPLCEEAE